MNMHVTPQQLHTLCDIADAAGREIMSVYSSDLVSWTKDDASPLTEADLRADTVIRQQLDKAFPGVFILSEESSSAGARETSTFFLVDPLDGTKEFLKRNDEFTVNIALVHLGHVIAGVVLAPALDALYFAAKGLGACKRQAGVTSPIAVAGFDGSRPLRVIGSRSHGGEAVDAWLSSQPHAHTFVAAGSSLKFCRIADGQADIYPRFGLTSQWDTAAAQCILEVAGGTVIDMDGAPLRYGLDLPILNPHFMAMGDARLASNIS